MGADVAWNYTHLCYIYTHIWLIWDASMTTGAFIIHSSYAMYF